MVGRRISSEKWGVIDCVNTTSAGDQRGNESDIRRKYRRRSSAWAKGEGDGVNPRGGGYKKKENCGGGNSAAGVTKEKKEKKEKKHHDSRWAGGVGPCMKGKVAAR